MPFYIFTKKNLSKNGSQYRKLIRGYDILLDATTNNN